MTSSKKEPVAAGSTPGVELAPNKMPPMGGPATQAPRAATHSADAGGHLKREGNITADAGGHPKREGNNSADAGGHLRHTGNNGTNGTPPGTPPNAPGGRLPAGESPGAKGQNLFKHEPPEGHAKKVSEVLGEVVWLMSQSQIHKQFFISDLELARRACGKRKRVMTPVLLQQFRTFYATDRPIGVVLWASVSDEVAARLAEGISKLRPQDWKSGDKLWVVEVIAPFGGAEEMVKDLKEKVFPDKPVNFLAVTKEGKKEIRSV